MTNRIWETWRGDSPLVALAIHDGHALRAEVEELVVLGEADRLREEDPYTADWTEIVPNRVVGLRSRFEVDLNRPRDKAVYRRPSDSWGLKVWRSDVPEQVIARSLTNYDAFYSMLGRLYAELAAEHGRFVVLDLHSYNHRRNGPRAPDGDPLANPQVNVGTGTMPDRERWSRVIERFINDLAGFEFPNGPLDVRENVRFRGGNCASWTHANFPDSACVLSVEVKKFFMDEWTGVPDPTLIAAMRAALASTVSGLIDEIARP